MKKRSTLKVLLLLFSLIFIVFISFATWQHLSTQKQVNNLNNITVRTNKTVYRIGEEVDFNVLNKSAISVYYAQEVQCGKEFWELHSCLGKEIEYKLPCEWATYQHRFTELKTEGVLNGTWDGKVMNQEYKIETAKPGCYKIVFPYTTISKAEIGEGWGNDRLEVYSSSFFIK